MIESGMRKSADEPRSKKRIIAKLSDSGRHMLLAETIAYDVRKFLSDTANWKTQRW